MTATILHGDCLELMKTLPDRSIDLFLCDLPYGCLGKAAMVKHENGTDKTAYSSCDWDIKIDLASFWVQVERLMKDDHTPIIHFCSTKFGVDLINSNPKWFRYDLVWNKKRGISFLCANKMPMRSHELIYVFSKKGARYNRIDELVEGKTAYCRTQLKQNPDNIYGITDRLPRQQTDGRRCVMSVVDVFSMCKKGQHPTQKPAELYKWLIERYSNEGDTILDPTAGSFASVFTAVSLGRDGIGMEMNDAFYNKANERAGFLRGSEADIQIPTLDRD